MATAAPSDPLQNAALFAAQVSELVDKNLVDEDSFVFDHLSQIFGYVILAKAIFAAHGQADNLAEFKRMVDHIWKWSDDLVTITVAERK